MVRSFLAVAALVLVPAAVAGPVTKTLGVDPSSPTAGQQIVFSGCGYKADRQVGLGVNDSAGVSVLGFVATAGADGCFATDFTFSLEAGTYEAFTFAYHGAGSFDNPRVFVQTGFVVS